MFGIWELALILGAIGSLLILYWWNFGFFIGNLAVGASAFAVCIFMYFAKQSPGLDDALLQVPIFGALYEIFFRRETYFREDTRLMYLDVVGRIVKHQMEEFTRVAGVKSVDIKECHACRSKDRRDELMK